MLELPGEFLDWECWDGAHVRCREFHRKKIWYEIYKLRAKPQNVGIALIEFLLVSFPRGKKQCRSWVTRTRTNGGTVFLDLIRHRVTYSHSKQGLGVCTW